MRLVWCRQHALQRGFAAPNRLLLAVLVVRFLSHWKDIIMADDEPKSLLGSMPPTDPAILREMEERRTERLHYAAIGRVAAAWAYFETIIDSSSIQLAGLLEDTGICFTANIMGVGRKLDTFIALARLNGISKKLTADLHKFAEDARGLGTQRDRVAHDAWFFPHPDSPYRLEITAVKLARIEQVPVTTQELLQLSEKIDALPPRFAGLLAQLHIERHPLPDTSP